MIHAPPIERFYDLNRLSEAGYEADLSLGPVDLQKLAAWADVVSVNAFRAHVSLSRLSSTRFGYAAWLKAEITQTCTVTLERIDSSIALDFQRTLHLVAHARDPMEMTGELSLAAGDDEIPEEIDSPRYDLAAPLLEEFLLAIDRYPRAPGAVFDAPVDNGEEAPANPFAILRGLKAKS